MEKRSLFSEDVIQPYTLQQFDDPVTAEQALEPASDQTSLSEEELRERVQKLEQAARDAGYAAGHGEGFAKGLSDGKEEVNATLKRLLEIIASLEQFREEKLTELLPHIIELSLEIAGKVVHKEIELDRNLILSVAKDSLRKVGEKEEAVVIRVNPLDYEVMIQNIDALKEQSGLKTISIEPLATISPGGCYIETLTGEIDARIEEQLKEVRDVIGTATHRKI